TARDSINAAPPEARIISRATPATKPAYPKKLPIVLIAAFAAFALSAGLTITGALLGSPPAVYSYDPDSDQPTLPEMMAPPLVPAVDRMPRSAPAGAPASSTIEQVARDLRAAAGDGRSVAVAGTARNVGTTHAAIVLARAL